MTSEKSKAEAETLGIEKYLSIDVQKEIEVALGESSDLTFEQNLEYLRAVEGLRVQIKSVVESNQDDTDKLLQMQYLYCSLGDRVRRIIAGLKKNVREPAFFIKLYDPSSREQENLISIGTVLKQS